MSRKRKPNISNVSKEIKVSSSANDYEPEFNPAFTLTNIKEEVLGDSKDTSITDNQMSTEDTIDPSDIKEYTCKQGPNAGRRFRAIFNPDGVMPRAKYFEWIDKPDPVLTRLNEIFIMLKQVLNKS